MQSNSKLVNGARQHDALTENGAITHSTSLNSVVDLFFIAGASRDMPKDQIIRLFTAARVENKNLAYKCLFWARDIRGGAGERRFFHIIMEHVRAQYNQDWKMLYKHIPEYGYWKDLFSMTPNEELIKFVIEHIQKADGLCCKWMPRKGDWFKAIRRYMNTPPAELRHMIVRNTKVVEQQMCANKWGDINFSHVPSIAFKNYKKAFDRHDHNRFQMFLDAVLKGEKKVNASAVFPYQLYQEWKKSNDSKGLEAQWNNLPNYVTNDISFLPVCDVSGSMEGMPLDISISLGVYLSERNKSVFKNAFITFNGKPRMMYLEGTVAERFVQLRDSDRDMCQNTDLQATFRLILDSAIRGNLKQEDMPNIIVIISDMEFDRACGNQTNFEAIQKQYRISGYEMPVVVFWNVRGREGNVPISASQPNVALVSGASPSIVKSVLTQKNITPTDVMLETLNSERYERITVG